MLSVPQGVSTSSATIYREQGDISFNECSKLSEDMESVKKQRMTIDEFKQNARQMKYSTNLGNGYCAQLSFKNDAFDSDKVDEIVKEGNMRAFAIRRVTEAGGYSSGTKLFIHPSIPFRIKFNGQEISVSTMTLFHPSPIRVDNIQHDAVLTLGDIASDSNVLIIPLVGALRPRESGRFISKLASYIPATLQAQPGTGIFPRVNVPTGNDWNLSMLFPGSPDSGETIVDVGYFVWNTVPPIEKYLKDTVQKPVTIRGFPFTQTTYVYDWRSITPTGKRIIMLNKPIEISSFDLQSIKMLPATTTELPPPIMESLVYHTPTSCAAAAGGSSLKEGFVISANSLRDAALDQVPDIGGGDMPTIDRCDPLANIPTPPSKIDSDVLITWILGIIGAGAVFIGVYYAIKFLPQWAPHVKKAADKIGDFLAGAGRGIKKASVAVATPVGQAVASAKTGIDTRIASAKQGMEKRREESRRRTRSRERETELKRQEAIRGFETAEKRAAEEKAAKAAIEERRLEAKMAPKPTPEVKPEDVKVQIKEEPKAETKPFDRSKMTTEELRKEARAAGTGLFDEEINAKRAEEAERKEQESKEVEKELRQSIMEINLKKVDAERKQQEILKRVEEAKQKVEDAKKKAEEDLKKIQDAKVELIKKQYTREQIERMLEERKARKAKESLDQMLKRIDEESKAADILLEQSKKEAAKFPIAKPPPVKAPEVPPHQRGLPVKTGTKKPSAAIPEPKPAGPPKAPESKPKPAPAPAPAKPMKSLQERVDEQQKKSLTQYRAPTPRGFGSSTGRWSSKEERDLAEARTRLGLSKESVRRSGRGRKRKNISNI